MPWAKMVTRVGPGYTCRWCDSRPVFVQDITPTALRLRIGYADVPAGVRLSLLRCGSCGAVWVVVPSQGYRIVRFVQAPRPPVVLPEYALKWLPAGVRPAPARDFFARHFHS